MRWRSGWIEDTCIELVVIWVFWGASRFPDFFQASFYFNRPAHSTEGSVDIDFAIVCKTKALFLCLISKVCQCFCHTYQSDVIQIRFIWNSFLSRGGGDGVDVTIRWDGCQAADHSFNQKTLARIIFEASDKQDIYIFKGNRFTIATGLSAAFPWSLFLLVSPKLNVTNH